MHDENLDISPEQLLWKNVILTFFHDLQRDVLRFKEANDSSKYIYKNRLQYLRRNAFDPHLKLVCDLAEINHQTFIKTVDKIIKGDLLIKIPRADFFRVPREFN